MPPSKPPTSTEVKVPCISCGQACPDGLRYCLYCGGKTLEIDKPSLPMNPVCPKCGETDELNISFCVSCGTKLLTLDAPTSTPRASRKTGFNWTLEESPPPAIRMAMRSINESSAAPSSLAVDGNSALMPILLGTLTALVAIACLFASGGLPYVLARLTWPKTGLVVYCPVDGTTGVQFSLENLETHVVTVAPVQTPVSVFGSGGLRCLVLRNLPAGNYMVKVQKGGTIAAFGLVTVAQDRPSVIGYPSGIRLPI